MRCTTLLSLTGLCLWQCATPAHALIIHHTEPRRMDAIAFTRFGELLGLRGIADPTRVVLFNDSKSKKGLFFETELDTQVSQLPAGSVAVLEIITEDEKQPIEFKYPIPTVKSSAKALYLGVTSEPFNTTERKELPRLLAWRVSILNAKGEVLARAPSAVWGR